MNVEYVEPLAGFLRRTRRGRDTCATRARRRSDTSATGVRRKRDWRAPLTLPERAKYDGYATPARHAGLYNVRDQVAENCRRSVERGRGADRLVRHPRG